MKTKGLAGLLAMAGASFGAGQSATPQKATVIVCMQSDQQALMGVRPLASAMFASIAVRIDWRERDSCPVGLGAIQVRLLHDSSGVRDSSAGALAFAQPYKGTVVVFLDRVQVFNRNGEASVLAHVLVHEITHVVEGIDRHSATGVMKAYWTYDDYLEMRHKPMTFAAEDVNLIYASLKVPPVAPAGAGSQMVVAGQ